MKNLTPMATTANDGILHGRNVKKNAFRRVKPGAYLARFIRQVGGNIEEVLHGDLEEALMVRSDERTGGYKLRIGLGGKNEYVTNDYHAKEEFLEYDSLEEVRDALQVILKKAKEGEFSDALENLRETRQKRADVMVSAQNRPNQGTFGKTNEAA